MLGTPKFPLQALLKTFKDENFQSFDFIKCSPLLSLSRLIISLNVICKNLLFVQVIQFYLLLFLLPLSQLDVTKGSSFFFLLLIFSRGA